MEALKYGKLSGKILKIFYDVYNKLGVGLSEDIYLEALQIGLECEGLSVERNRLVAIRYKDKKIGDLRLEIIVSNRILVKVKVSQVLQDNDELSILTELKHSNLPIGLLLIFGSSPSQKRIYNPQILD